MESTVGSVYKDLAKMLSEVPADRAAQVSRDLALVLAGMEAQISLTNAREALGIGAK